MWEWLCSLTVSDLTSIVQAIAVVVVAIPAFRGLNAWRDELLGKKKIELAEEALCLAYELQSVIEWARHPASRRHEGEDRPGRDDEPEHRQNLNDAYYSRISRLNENAEEFARLRTILPRVRVHFGADAHAALHRFGIVRNQINNAVGMLISNSTEDGYPRDLYQRHQDIIWDTCDDDNPDEIRRQVNEAVTSIEEICFPVLRKR